MDIRFCPERFCLSQIRPLYSGSYRVLQRKEKHFVVDINDKQNTISIDRLKEAIVEPDFASSSSTPHQTDTTSSTPLANTLNVITAYTYKKWPKMLLAGEIRTSTHFQKRNSTWVIYRHQCINFYINKAFIFVFQCTSQGLNLQHLYCVILPRCYIKLQWIPLAFY